MSTVHVQKHHRGVRLLGEDDYGRPFDVVLDAFTGCVCGEKVTQVSEQALAGGLHTDPPGRVTAPRTEAVS